MNSKKSLILLGMTWVLVDGTSTGNRGDLRGYVPTGPSRCQNSWLSAACLPDLALWHDFCGHAEHAGSTILEVRVRDLQPAGAINCKGSRISTMLVNDDVCKARVGSSDIILGFKLLPHAMTSQTPQHAWYSEIGPH
jgi:hypothetical protein